MLDIMSQAKGAIDAYNEKLRAISSNITNLSVTGYKRTDVSFETIYSKLIQSGTSGSNSGGDGGTDPLQIGGTVGVSSATVDFTQGDISSGGNLDLAVNGNGLFIVSDDGVNYKYSRTGEFQVIGNKLLTKSGKQVYGFRRVNGSTVYALVPIDLSSVTYDPTTITFDQNGVLRASYDPDTETYGAEIGYQVALTSFNNPSGLEYSDGSTFTETLASGTPSNPFAGTGGLLVARSRESSNVEYTSEIVDSLEIQRAMNAALTAVRLVNQVISDFISKLG